MTDKLTPEQLAKIKPIPYSDDEQEDNDYAQLSHEQLEKINRQNSGNFVEGLVDDAITADKDKPKIAPLPRRLNTTVRLMHKITPKCGRFLYNTPHEYPS